MPVREEALETVLPRQMSGFTALLYRGLSTQDVLVELVSSLEAVARVLPDSERADAHLNNARRFLRSGETGAARYELEAALRLVSIRSVRK